MEIPAGSGTRTIGDRLVAAGVVRDPLTFRAALLISGQARVLKAGEYRFDRPMTPLEAMEKIARGDVYVVTVTIPEGLNIREMAALAESRGVGTAAEFIKGANDRSLFRGLDPSARNLEGYLFPDTYPVTRTDTRRLVRAMAGRFEHVLTPEMREAVEQRGLSLHQTVTLASIVEKEAARPDERPMVAAVYLNRIRRRHPAAVRPDGHLRAPARRQVQRQPAARRSDVRFAVQHLPISGTASRSDRVAGQSRARGRRFIPPTSTTCIS